ncbi:MAG TPA: ThuA domain-containing protein [Verrucomicrobiae bacterium]|nr:ThuA domain-containing protein [Verrucomicrobiae bacterium]
MALTNFPWCALWLLLTGLWAAVPVGASAGERFSALVFSKTLLFRHASITNGIAAIRQLGEANHFDVDATEEAAVFTPANLSKYKVVILLSTSGEIFNNDQKAALKAYVESGGGLAGIHAAVAGDLATEGGWLWYSDALCARFTNHSAVVQATVRIEDHKNPSTATLPSAWVRTDEWYNFISSPRGQARILASVEESTYHGGTMGRDHPIAWYRTMGKGRVWYTALGHTEASYSEPLFLEHLLGGVRWAAGVTAWR